MHPQLNPVSFDKLNGWKDDGHAAAFRAFCSSARHMLDKPYKTRALGVDATALVRIAQAAVALDAEYETGPDSAAARSFFERHFAPHRIAADPGRDHGFLTGFFEPEMPASRIRSEAFPIPLLRQPNDLVEVDDSNRPEGWPSEFRFGRLTKNGLEEFHDRGAIHGGALDGQGLELVYLKNLVDMFFIHVQGSAKLLLDDGDIMRVTYSAKSGHPYTSLGKVLCARLGVTPEQMKADVLRQWMLDHPDELPDLLALNRSYIFFREVKGLDPELGPIAAAKVPLIAGRSLAVDRTLHTFGSPVWIETHEPLPSQSEPTRRLMIAHDTGSAITGAARGDYFSGSGYEAGIMGGRILHDIDMIVFLPKA